MRAMLFGKKTRFCVIRRVTLQIALGIYLFSWNFVPGRLFFSQSDFKKLKKNNDALLSFDDSLMAFYEKELKLDTHSDVPSIVRRPTDLKTD